MDCVTISTKVGAFAFGDLTSDAREMGGAMSNDSKIVFKLGLTSSYGGTANVMEVINVSTTGSAVDFGDADGLTRASDATSNDTGGRGVIAGGRSTSGPAINVIEWVNISASIGNGTVFGDLTVARLRVTAVSNGAGDRAVFGGGSGTTSIDYITISSSGTADIFGELIAGNSEADGVSNAAT